MKQVEIYARVRHAVLIEGISERAAAKQFGINARTVSKMLKFSVPPGYVRTKPPCRPKHEDPYRHFGKQKVLHQPAMTVSAWRANLSSV